MRTIRGADQRLSGACDSSVVRARREVSARRAAARGGARGDFGVKRVARGETTRMSRARWDDPRPLAADSGRRRGAHRRRASRPRRPHSCPDCASSGDGCPSPPRASARPGPSAASTSGPNATTPNCTDATRAAASTRKRDRRRTEEVTGFMRLEMERRAVEHRNPNASRRIFATGSASSCRSSYGRPPSASRSPWRPPRGADRS